MAQHHGPRGHDLPTERRPPVRTVDVDGDLADDDVDHAVEQVLLAADVGVERHGLDAEILAEPAHADRFDALPIGEVDGGLQDTRPVQRDPPVLVPEIDGASHEKPLDILTSYGLPYAIWTSPYDVWTPSVPHGRRPG